MHGIRLDLRASVRSLLRTPGYTLTALLMLALGIGASSAIYGVVRAVLLQPLPFPEPRQLVWLCEENPRIEYCVTSPPNAYDWARLSRTLDGVGVARNWQYSVAHGDKVRGMNAGIATPELFSVLRVRPQAGRLLLPADQNGVGSPVVVLSDELWRTEFGADPAAVGSTITLDGEPYTIVGVAPRGLRVPGLMPPELWKPLHIDPRGEDHRNWRGFSSIARVKPGVTLEAVRSDLRRVSALLAEQRPETNAGWGVRVQSLQEQVVGRARPMLLLFSIAVLLVLLIVCANTASLILARFARRQYELAVHAANGASRGRIVRQLLLESSLLSAGAAVLGFLFARRGTALLLAMAPNQLPRTDEIRLGVGVFLFALALSLLITASVGLLPAIWASRNGVEPLLRAGSGRTTRGFGRGRAALVASEVMLSVMLLAAAGVLLRSLVTQLRWDPGFERAGVLVTQIFPPSQKYADAQLTAFYTRAEESLAALPGVSSVGSGSAGPLFGGLDAFDYTVDGDGDAIQRNARTLDVDPGYRRTLGIALVRGRDFNAGDRAGSPPVAMVNQRFAQLNWPASDPLGHHIRFQDQGRESEVVGVVKDVPPFPGESERTEPLIYVPQAQGPRGATFLVVRSGRDASPLVPQVRAALLQLEPELSVGTPVTLRDQLQSYTAAPRFRLILIGLFALCALVLSIAGLYSVLAYTANQQMREYGIRLALGGRPRDVALMVLRQALKVVGAGVVLGLVGAALGASLLQKLVVGVQARDPATYLAVAVLLALVALAASLGPALRAAGREPLRSLRET